MTVFVDLILLFCPGFLATVAVLGNKSLPSVEVTNFCGGCFVPKDKNFLNRFYFSFSVLDCHWALVH